MHFFTTSQLEILLVITLVSLSCVIPGTLLVLRRVALLTDALSHSILLGIVGVFLFTEDLHSPWLIVGALGSGLLCVFLTEQLIANHYLRKEASIAVVFPAFFALAILLISLFADKVHLDADVVLLGELAFTPFNRLSWKGIDLGPVAVWFALSVLGGNVLFLVVFYKELKITIFDQTLAALLGFSPVFFHYATITLAGLTVVSAFDAAGVVLVIGFMVVPPATALLLTKSFSMVLLLSALVGWLASLLGYVLAVFVDASIAGSVTVVMGGLFLLALLFSPSMGMALGWFKFKSRLQSLAARVATAPLASVCFKTAFTPRRKR